jgi:hypothetical protein
MRRLIAYAIVVTVGGTIKSLNAPAGEYNPATEDDEREFQLDFSSGEPEWVLRNVAKNDCSQIMSENTSVAQNAIAQSQI